MKSDCCAKSSPSQSGDVSQHFSLRQGSKVDFQSAQWASAQTLQGPKTPKSAFRQDQKTTCSGELYHSWYNNFWPFSSESLPLKLA